MIKKPSRASLRQKRHRRVRVRVSGTSQKPRLCVYRSLKHIYAQLIDDTSQRTLVACSTLEDQFKDLEGKDTVQGARAVGEAIAKKALEKGITEVVFDRNGYKYHGRVAALAEAAREAGLKF